MTEIKNDLKAKESPAEELSRVKAELAGLKKSQEKFEEEALKAACESIGIKPADMLAQKAAQKAGKEMVEYDIGEMVVHINGKPFTGRGVVTLEEAECILHMASMSRDEKMKSMIGRNYAVMGGMGGPITTRLVGTVQN